MNVKQVLDKLFEDYNFDTALYKKIVFNNIEFITKNEEYRNLFGSKLIGNHIIKYTSFDKNIFYNNVFNLDLDFVLQSIEKITTINKNFKIARDDINLVTFYIAHRFLSNDSLDKNKRIEYAKEILNYFSYRTLVLISSSYFIYPISEEKAITLSERLNNKYLIKRLKNWNEYCQYRSDEYLDSKYVKLLTTFNKDSELPNAISDLFGRTKDTLKNIYKEFIDMNENDQIIKSKSSVMNDIEGQEVIIDKLNTPESYYTKIENLLVDKQSFIRKEYIDVTVDIIDSVSAKSMQELLNNLIDFSFIDKDKNLLIKSFMKNVLINTIDYLQKNNIYLNKSANTLEILSYIVGNVLYARGTDVNVNKVKDEGEDLIKLIFKQNKKYISDRNIKNLRNAFYIYIVLLAII